MSASGALADTAVDMPLEDSDMTTTTTTTTTTTVTTTSTVTTTTISGTTSSSATTPTTIITATGTTATSTVSAPTNTWTLSLYELQRTPQEVIKDDTEVAVSPQSLHSELMCPICLELLKNTMTTMECLHRFCSDCITTALRAGNKECPTCRKKLVSKRSLRRDENFDKLIAIIYPKRGEYEEQQERLMERMRKNNSTAALTANIEEGMKSQLMNRTLRAGGGPGGGGGSSLKRSSSTLGDGGENSGGTAGSGVDSPAAVAASSSGLVAGTVLHKRKKWLGAGARESDADSSGETASEAGSTTQELSAAGQQAAVATDLILRPHPDDVPPGRAEDESAVKYLKTTSNAMIEHMAKYMEMRENIVPPGSASDPAATSTTFSIYVSTGGPSESLTLLPKTMILAEVSERYAAAAQVSAGLELFYKKNSPAPTPTEL